jgi:hypothetical protein
MAEIPTMEPSRTQMRANAISSAQQEVKKKKGEG